MYFFRKILMWCENEPEACSCWNFTDLFRKNAFFNKSNGMSIKIQQFPSICIDFKEKQKLHSFFKNSLAINRFWKKTHYIYWILQNSTLSKKNLSILIFFLKYIHLVHFDTNICFFFQKPKKKMFFKTCPIWYFFVFFLARILTIIIHFLKRILDYESRCLSQADDPSLLLFHLHPF